MRGQGDNDDFGVFGDVADYFDTEANETDFAELRASVPAGQSRPTDLPAPMAGGPKKVGTGPNPAATPAPAEKVTLRDQAGTTTATLDEATFAGLFNDVFGRALDEKWSGSLAPLGVVYLAQAANKRGLAEVAKTLDDLKQGMQGLAVVTRSDGQPWSPPRVGGLNTATSPAPADEVNVRKVATATDISSYFAGDDDEGK
jgi:hypothetical protein